MTENAAQDLPLVLDQFGVALPDSREFPGVSVSTVVGPGEAVAFTGPIGSGKSLLLLALGGITLPAFRIQGSASVGKRPPRVALVSQDRRWAALPSDTVAALLRMQNSGSKPDAEAYFPALFLDSKKIRALHFRSLSSSEQVRVLLCLALSGPEEVIALDGWGECLSPLEERATLALFRDEMRRGRKIIVAARSFAPELEATFRVVPVGLGEMAQSALPLVRRAPKVEPEGPRASSSRTRVLLELKNVSATRALQSLDPSARLVVIRAVSFWVRAGKSLALLGAPGSGKTALLETIQGLSERRVGRIRLDGVPLAAHAEKRSKRERRALQLVLEDARSCVDPDESVQAIFTTARRENPTGTRQVEAWLERLHLPARLLHLAPDDLSEGEVARLALARALSSSPHALLIDGPRKLGLSKADSSLLPLLGAEYERGMAAIFATSDPALARLLGEDVAILHAGSVMEIGPTDEVLTAPLHPATAFLLNGARPAQFDPRDPPVGCPFVPDCAKRVLPTCSERTPQLASLDGRKNGRRVACHFPLDEATPRPTLPFSKEGSAEVPRENAAPESGTPHPSA